MNAPTYSTTETSLRHLIFQKGIAMKHLLLASIGLIGLTAPSLVAAQTVTLATTPSSTQSTVTTSFEPACGITSSLTAIAVTIPLNGGAVTPTTGSAGTVTVTCNTPAGVVAIGSSALKNAAPIDAGETATFTNEIDFAGVALRTDESDWRLASRPNTATNAWQSARLDANVANTRIQTLTISARGFSTLNKLPVAGAYVGTICLTVNPTGTPLNAQASATCPLPTS